MQSLTLPTSALVAGALLLDAPVDPTVRARPPRCARPGGPRPRRPHPRRPPRPLVRNPRRGRRLARAGSRARSPARRLRPGTHAGVGPSRRRGAWAGRTWARSRSRPSPSGPSPSISWRRAAVPERSPDLAHPLLVAELLAALLADDAPGVTAALDRAAGDRQPGRAAGWPNALTVAPTTWRLETAWTDRDGPRGGVIGGLHAGALGHLGDQRYGAPARPPSYDELGGETPCRPPAPLRRCRRRRRAAPPPTPTNRRDSRDRRRRPRGAAPRPPRHQRPRRPRRACRERRVRRARPGAGHLCRPPPGDSARSITSCARWSPAGEPPATLPLGSPTSSPRPTPARWSTTSSGRPARPAAPSSSGCAPDPDLAGRVDDLLDGDPTPDDIDAVIDWLQEGRGRGRDRRRAPHVRRRPWAAARRVRSGGERTEPVGDAWQQPRPQPVGDGRRRVHPAGRRPQHRRCVRATTGRAHTRRA